ncbi:preprotein translocase subunit SecG [Croceicoccus marinus]|jgi:preprotein translocase subunit SecG|uniref:Protein-export membrane protein SecG n=1 Tax=Croceicoccus marinus TaxID=450378 RepID=A0A7G6VRI8_9SPHN|nr:preprotein translocase subunit SecG [Croceicoccus marinus]QNE04353.1 preprotein translocase subunit SecG [Croceicoccus marinus]
MSLFLFLTIVQAIVGAALVGAILMQQSEGGGLGVGGSPSGLMSARGAANFMTRATGILAVLFVVLSIILAALAVETTQGSEIDTSLDRSIPAVAPDPLAPAAPATAPAPAGAPAGEGAPAAGGDPLAGAAE